MDTTCPNCQSRVSIAADGDCPRCGHSLQHAASAEVNTADVDALFAAGDFGVDAAASLDHESTLGAEKVDAHVERPKGPSHKPASSSFPSQEPEAKRGPLRSLLWTMFSFQGRIPRSVFWIATMYFLFIDFLVGAILAGKTSSNIDVIVLLCFPLYMWILLAIWVKRWHDRGKTGWWVLINMIPVIGPIYALIEMGFLRGTEGWNDYGPDPT